MSNKIKLSGEDFSVIHSALLRESEACHAEMRKAEIRLEDAKDDLAIEEAKDSIHFWNSQRKSVRDVMARLVNA